MEPLEGRSLLSAGGLDTALGAVQAPTATIYYYRDPGFRTLSVSVDSYGFYVSYHAASRIDLATLDDGDIVVTGPNGFSGHARFLSSQRGHRGSTRIVSYAVDGPGERWASGQNGTYTFQLKAGQVADVLGNAAEAQNIGDFIVDMPVRAVTSDVVKTTGPIATARASVQAATVGHKALFAGGAVLTTPGPFSTALVDIYDADTDQWSTALLSDKRSGTPVPPITLGNKVYFAGGSTDSGVNDKVDIYDNANGQWSIITLPQAALIDSTTAVGDKAIFISRSGVSGEAVAYLYDTVTHQWSSHALPTSCGSGGAAGSMAVFPGSDNAAIVYDDDTGSWFNTRTPVSYNDGFGEPSIILSIGNQIILVRQQNLKIYDVDHDRWMSVDLPFESVLRAGIAVGTRVVVCDGYSVALYDVVTGKTTIGTLSGVRENLTIAAVGGKVLFAGGEFEDGDMQEKYSDLVDVYDIATARWSTASLSTPRFLTTAATAGNKIIFVGGKDLDTSQPQTTDAPDIFTDASPAPILSGSMTDNLASGAVAVTIQNSGDATRAGPFTVAIYAVSEKHKSILLGSTIVTTPLLAGETTQVIVPTTLPSGLELKDDRLIAAAGRGRRLQQIAKSDSSIPRATVIDAPVLMESARTYLLSVSYEGPYAIDSVTLNDDDLFVTGPGGYERYAKLVDAKRGNRGKMIAQYAIPGAAKRWTADQNGVYTIHLQGGEVVDDVGNGVRSVRLGRFKVAIPNSES